MDSLAIYKPVFWEIVGNDAQNKNVIPRPGQ